MEPFNKVIGYRNEKEDLLQIIDMLKNREAYESVGAKLPRGVLLYGDPGMGKTLLATSLIEAADVPVFAVRSVKEAKFVLEDIRKAFEEASKESCAIVFFDDVDKFSSSKGNDVDDPAFVAIQSGIDSVKDKNVLVVATANNMEKLPSSLVRNGRFDRKINICAPEGKDAERIVEFYLRKKKIDPNANFDDIAKLISYSSCADLDKIVNESAILAAYKGKGTIGTEDVVEAYLRDKYNVRESEDGGTLAKGEVALHEAGHCVVAEVLKKGSVGIVSTRTRDGFTKLCVPLERRPQCVLMGLGGKVANELYLEGRCASGCSEDLMDVTQYIHDGLTHSGTNGAGFLISGRRAGHSNAWYTRVENAMESELERYLFLCRGILIKNKDFLFALTKELYEKRTLLHSDIQRIRSQFKIVSCPDYSEPEDWDDEGKHAEEEFLAILGIPSKGRGEASLGGAA